jgi:tetratricopeptide (TPR) repeat protein
VAVLFLSVGCQKSRSPRTGEECYGLARQHFEKGEYLEAVTYLKKIDAQDEGLMAKTFYTLGRSLRMLGNFDEAYEYYHRVYQLFPTSSLADDTLAMSGGMLYNQKKYKGALDIYTKLFKEYPHSDVPAIRIWESMEGCLRNFKKRGSYFAFDDQRIAADHFLRLTLDVAHHRNSYSLLDRFNFWEDYSKRYQSNHKFRLEYIERLLRSENFLEAEKQIQKMSRESRPIAEYLEISKLYQLNKYDDVIDRTIQWLRDYRDKAPVSLVGDCFILRIESLIKKDGNNLVLLANEINDLFRISRIRGFYYVLQIYHKLNKEELLMLAQDEKSSSLVFFLLAQKYLDSGDFDKSQAYLKEGIARVPSYETQVLKRAEVLNEIHDILNGYYHSFSKEQFEKVYTNKFRRILSRASHFNRVAGHVLTKNEREINFFLTNKIASIKKINQLLEYRGPVPAYDEFVNSVSSGGGIFGSISEIFASRLSWDNKLGKFAIYKINELPTYTDDYYLNNFYYEAVKLLYMIYMNAGFSKETCNALFLQHMTFLNKQGVFGVYGDFDFTYGLVDDPSLYDRGNYYDESRDRIITYFRYNRFRNQRSELKKFKFDAEAILKTALKRVRKRSQEYVALSAYIQNCKVNKLRAHSKWSENEKE